MPVAPPLPAHVIASPDYLARRGTPGHPRELLEHDCSGFRHATSGQLERWTFARGAEKFDLLIKGRLILNDFEILLRTALEDLGITYRINGYIDPLIDRRRLARLLPDWSPRLPALHL